MKRTLDKSKVVSADEALEVLNSENNVFIQTGSSTPLVLIDAMLKHSHRLKNVSIYQLHTEGEAAYTKSEFTGVFNTHCFFIGNNVRSAVHEARADYIPIFLSEIPTLFRSKTIPLDVALIQVSPPDKHGYCSLGVSVDIALSAIENAKYVIAQVNENMPRVLGGGIIHISQITHIVNHNSNVPEVFLGEASDIEDKIASNVASLVEDGATLQMGIGKIPNAVLSKLKNHHKLGIHSEMFSDGIIDLIDCGAVTGELKMKHPHKVVGGFAIGTRRLYDFMDDNPLVELHDSAYVNDTFVIRQNPKVTAINSAIEIDLTGQVCADSVGSVLYSGVGGQMDFIRGASLSPGGKPIIALPSITSKGESKIVTMLKQGAGVVTTRSHVHYVVTEYGVTNLYGKNIKQRVKALIEIAHPDFREQLDREAFEMWKIY